MNKEMIVSKFNKLTFGLKKHSPEILLVSGIAGVIVAAVMACKATTKINDILDKTQEDLDVIKNSKEQVKEEYPDQVYKKDLTMVYIQTGWRFVKLYAPSVLVGTISISSILASNNVLKKRNIALAAAYTAVDKGFKEYRNRVIERFGNEIDHEIRNGIKTETVEREVIDPETGEKKTVSETITTPNTNCSPYSKIFDETNPNWVKNSEYNLFFITAAQKIANDKLIAQGYLFLNEVYDALGIPLTKAGQVVGWIYNPNDKTINSYVDFGIFNQNKQSNLFVNGYERSIKLDFNVDGVIWNSVNYEEA